MLADFQTRLLTKGVGSFPAPFLRSKKSQVLTRKEMSTKYIVSNELCVEAAGNNEFYEIFNNKTKRDYRITPGMFKVLNLFEKGSSQEEVIEAIAREVNTEYKQISDLISPFIDFLVRSKSIINETVLKNNENTFNAGDTYKNYIIQDLIACNNKTEVYKCYNIETKSSYILKTLVKKNTASALQEKKLALALNNEFEITFKASTNNELVIKPVEKITDNIHGLILEFFDGDTIPAFLMKVKPENIKLSIEKLVLQILDGFELIHANSIVHGDIHLNNILVNDDLQIKIIDFGLADELDTKKYNKIRWKPIFLSPGTIGPKLSTQVHSAKQHCIRSLPDWFDNIFCLLWTITC